MADAVLLNMVLYLPLLGTAALLAVPSRREDAVRLVSLDRAVHAHDPSAEPTVLRADLGESDLCRRGPVTPAWIPCPCCENFLCTIHGMHAHDCPCPPVDEWPTDPYADPQPAVRPRPAVRRRRGGARPAAMVERGLQRDGAVRDVRQTR